MNWIGSYCIECRIKLKYKATGCYCHNQECPRYGLLTILVLDGDGVLREL